MPPRPRLSIPPRPTTALTRTIHTTTSLKMRIPYAPNPPPDSLPASTQEVYARVAARRAPRPLQPLDLALLHSPPIADGWNSFLGAVRTRADLPADLREVAVSRVAVVNAAWYEWMHHAPLARAAGVSSAAMDGVVKDHAPVPAVPNPEDSGLDDRQWAVLRYADEMTRNVRVADETFALLRGLFNEREIIEITATVACYNCVSRFLVALDVGEKNSVGPDEAEAAAHH